MTKFFNIEVIQPRKMPLLPSRITVRDGVEGLFLKCTLFFLLYLLRAFMYCNVYLELDKAQNARTSTKYRETPNKESVKLMSVPT